MAETNAPAVEESLGVNVHFIDPRPGEVKMIAETGFRWVRTDFKWELTEHEPGNYDFSAYDRLLKQLDEFGLRALFILDYGNPLYTNDKPVRTPAARAAFARWAVAAAKHFADRGVLWELFNEPNNKMFWPPQPEAAEYVALAREVATAFRAASIDGELIGPATSQIDFNFIDQCLSGDVATEWSAISVHPYRQQVPETAALEYAHLRELLRTHSSESAALKIISSEWGYSSVWSRMDQPLQAIMLARSLLTNLANGIPLSIWYDWHDDGRDPTDPEDHFGLVGYETRMDSAVVYDPKPAFLAAKTLTTMLKGFHFQERIKAGSADDYVLVFSRANASAEAGEQRLVIWSAATPHTLTIPNLSGRFSLTTVTGGGVGEISVKGDGLTITSTNSPVYLVPLN